MNKHFINFNGKNQLTKNGMIEVLTQNNYRLKMIVTNEGVNIQISQNKLTESQGKSYNFSSSFEKIEIEAKTRVKENEKFENYRANLLAILFFKKCFSELVNEKAIIIPKSFLNKQSHG